MTAGADAALLERVRGRLAADGLAPSPRAVAAALRGEPGLLGNAAVADVVTVLRRELAGAGPLEPLLDLAGVTDVLVNGPDEVWVDRGGGLERADVGFPDDAAVRRLAVRLAGAAGRRLDDASPWVDARLRGGVRLHAVLPPVSPRGTVLSLRLPPASAFTLDQLRAAGTVDPRTAEVLAAVVSARLAFLVTGGTGSGKTTLLSTLLGLVPAGERLVLVEDSGELRPDHPHVVRLEARPPNLEGAGEATLRDLVRQALRMRPDRLVVGEVRGAEVVDLLAALNTGHDGGAGTLHANQAADVPARVEALSALAGLDQHATRTQLVAAVQVVIHIVRRAGLRRVSSVSVLSRGSDGVVVRPAVADGCDGPGAAQLAGLLR
jgi:pilus assembly protein CpaF